MFTNINHLGTSSVRLNEHTAKKADLSQVVVGSTVYVGADLPRPGQQLPLAAQPKSTEQAKPTEEELNKVVSNLNEFVQSVRRELQFSVDDDTGRYIVKVLNKETDEVVRQIPSEEVLAISSYLQTQAGLLIDTEA